MTTPTSTGHLPADPPSAGSHWLALVRDLRGEGRGARVSSHVEAGFLVLSTWKAGQCVSTVRLLPEEAALLIAGLAEGLASLAPAPGEAPPAPSARAARIPGRRTVTG